MKKRTDSQNQKLSSRPDLLPITTNDAVTTSRSSIRAAAGAGRSGRLRLLSRVHYRCLSDRGSDRRIEGSDHAGSHGELARSLPRAAPSRASRSLGYARK